MNRWISSRRSLSTGNDGWADGWMDRWNGWMEGWMDRWNWWMDGWIDRRGIENLFQTDIVNREWWMGGWKVGLLILSNVSRMTPLLACLLTEPAWVMLQSKTRSSDLMMTTTTMRVMMTTTTMRVMMTTTTTMMMMMMTTTTTTTMTMMMMMIVIGWEWAWWGRNRATTYKVCSHGNSGRR